MLSSRMYRSTNLSSSHTIQWLPYVLRFLCWEGQRLKDCMCINRNWKEKLTKTLCHAYKCLQLFSRILHMTWYQTNHKKSYRGTILYLLSEWEWTFNSLRPRQLDAISQTPFSNAFSWMKVFEFRSIYVLMIPSNDVSHFFLIILVNLKFS